MSAPRQGALSPFAQSDNFVLGRLGPLLGKGFGKNGKTYPVEIVVEDSQSTTTTSRSPWCSSTSAPTAPGT